MDYNFGSMFNKDQVVNNDLLGADKAIGEYTWGKGLDLNEGYSEAASMDVQNTDTSGISNMAKGAGKGMGIATSAMDFIGQGTNMINNINRTKSERMDERGNVDAKVNWAGNIGGMTLSGAKLGGSIVPGWGHVIGAGVGAIAGTVGSAIDSDRQPTGEDIRRAGETFELDNVMKTVRSEDSFARQQVMTAEDGMDVGGETKEIEVERDELVLRKFGKSFREVADFKGGDTHEQGGEPYIATEGDVIIPGKDRTKVKRMLKNRRWSAVESYRQKLPKDTPDGTAATGLDTGDPIKKGTKAKKKSINVYTYNPRLQDGAKKKKGIKYESIEGRDGLYDTTFTTEFNRGKSVLEGMYDEVNHIPIYDRDIMPDSIRENQGGDAMILDHSGDMIGGSSLESIGNALTDSGTGDCYMGICYGESYKSRFNTPGSETNIHYTDKDEKWKGFNPGKKGIEGIFPGGSVRYKGSEKQEYKMGTKEVKIGYKKGTKEIMPSYVTGTESINPTPGKGISTAAQKFMDQEGVADKIQFIADKYGFSVESLLNVIELESGFDPSIKNIPAKGQNSTNATGLIQFMPKTAKSLGTTIGKLSEMSALDQLDFVDDYFEKNHKKGTSPYLTVAYPSAASKNSDFVIGKKGSKLAKQNPGWVGSDGRVTVGSINAFSNGVTPELQIKMDRRDELRAKLENRDMGGDLQRGDGPINKEEASTKLSRFLEKQKEPRGFYAQADIYNDDISSASKAFQKAIKDEPGIIPLYSQDEADELAKLDEEIASFQSAPNTSSVRDIASAIKPQEIKGLTDMETTGFIPTDPKMKTSMAEIPAGSDKSKIGSNIAKGLGFVADYMPALYNIVRGSEKPSKVPRDFVSPQTREYTNLSQPQMNAIDQAFEMSMANSRNLSGGMMGNYRSNVESAWARQISQKDAVNIQEANRADQVANQNLTIRNRADEFNTGVNNKAEILDLQAEAATNSFMAQGMQDIANINAVKSKDRNAQKNENLLLNMIGSKNFDLNGFKG